MNESLKFLCLGWTIVFFLSKRPVLWTYYMKYYMRDIEFQRGDMVLVMTMARTLVVALTYQKSFVSPLPYYERGASYRIIVITPRFSSLVHCIQGKGGTSVFVLGSLPKGFGRLSKVPCDYMDMGLHFQVVVLLSPLGHHFQCECYMVSRGTCAWTHHPWMLALFGKVAEPLEVRLYWRKWAIGVGPWGFTTCFHCLFCDSELNAG